MVLLLFCTQYIAPFVNPGIGLFDVYCTQSPDTNGSVRKRTYPAPTLTYTDEFWFAIT